MTLNDEEFFCVRYELNMIINVSQKTQFEKLFKEKKFYEIPNPIYCWLGFKIAALGSEGLFDKILAAKTITEIPRAKKNRVDGPQLELPSGSTENLSLFKNREEEKEV